MNSIQNISVPYVLDNTKKERVLDLWSRLNQDRVLFVGETIAPHMSNIIVAQLLFLESENSESPIYMYINSPGGVVSSGMAIYDTMNYISPNIHTFCLGTAASMASILLAAGEPGHRYMTPNAEVMVHQPSGGAVGQETDIQIAAKRIARTKEKLTRIMAKHTGKSYKECLKDMERDYWMSADEALKYGIVDKIVTKRSKDDK